MKTGFASVLGTISFLFMTTGIYYLYSNPITDISISISGKLMLISIVFLLALVFSSNRSNSGKNMGAAKRLAVRGKFIVLLIVILVLILPTYGVISTTGLKQIDSSNISRLFNAQNQHYALNNGSSGYFINKSAGYGSHPSLEVVSYNQNPGHWVQVGSSPLNVTPGSEYAIKAAFSYNNTRQSALFVEVYSSSWKQGDGWKHSRQLTDIVGARNGRSGFKLYSQEFTIPNGYNRMALYVNDGWVNNVGSPSLVWVSDVHIYSVKLN